MILWGTPQVTLLSWPMFEHPSHINWTSTALTDAEALVEFAGRLCYLSFGKDAGIEGHKTISGRTTNAEYLENIKKTKHWSVTEHANWSFLFEGISRSLSHELVRHRHFSYSQLSQRYVDESEVGFVIPPELCDGSVAYDIWLEGMERVSQEYVALLKELEQQLANESSATLRKKRARQTARSVLPNCTETKIVVTGNTRAWRHFINLRASEYADTEIRRLAIEVLKQLKGFSPGLFGDYKFKSVESDGTLEAETDYYEV